MKAAIEPKHSAVNLKVWLNEMAPLVGCLYLTLGGEWSLWQAVRGREPWEWSEAGGVIANAPRVSQGGALRG